MTESYRALCSDLYVNQKVSVKMELPRSRESVLELFERMRKQFPAMNQFRRARDEYALESPQSDAPHRWLALKPTNIRTGTVNPAGFTEAYQLHKSILDTAPTYLSITPLDLDYIELLYGFDLQAGGNHDAIVLDALVPGSPLAALLNVPGATPIDCQPVIGLSIPQSQIEVHFEVKTRPPAMVARDPENRSNDPISVYLTLRKFGSVADLKDLIKVFNQMASIGEELVETRLVPGLLMPIREAIGSGNI